MEIPAPAIEKIMDEYEPCLRALGGGMSVPQEEDLKWLKEEITKRLDEKYRAGQKEHGGNGWEMGLERLTLESINEHIDGIVYNLWILKNLKGRGDRE